MKKILSISVLVASLVFILSYPKATTATTLVNTGAVLNLSSGNNQTGADFVGPVLNAQYTQTSTSTYPAPTAKLTAYGQEGTVTAYAGDSINYQWSSTNADTGQSYYTSSTCGSGAWSATSTSGTKTATTSTSQIGCKYTILFVVTQASTTRTARAELNINVVALPAGVISVHNIPQGGPFVGPVLSAPIITSVTPLSGSVESQVAIKGYGFTATGNTVKFGDNIISNLPSASGTITFTIPKYVTPGCIPTAGHACTNMAVSNSPGQYPVYVTTVAGTNPTAVVFNLLAPVDPTPIPPTVTPPATTTDSTTIFTKNLRVGDRGADVTLLQEFLISKGYNLSYGATSFFGFQTKAALIQFQVDNGISPAVGFFGAITRALANSQYSGVHDQNLSITSVSPQSANTSDSVTITGTGFTNASKVSFSNESINLNLTPASYASTSITFLVPLNVPNDNCQSGSTGPTCTQGAPIDSDTYQIAIKNGQLTSNHVDLAVTYTTVPAKPVISSVNPTTGTVGTAITITGSGFTAIGNRLQLNDHDIQSLGNSNGTTLSFNIPTSYPAGSCGPSCNVESSPIKAGDTLYLGIKNANGSSNNVTFAVTGQTTNSNQPTITSISPTSGATSTNVTLTGTNFTSASEIKFEGQGITLAVTPNSFTATSIVFKIPNGTTTVNGTQPLVNGSYDVSVRNGTMLSNVVKFIANNGTSVATVPVISVLNPITGSAGTSVTITGSGFTPTGNQVFFGQGLSTEAQLIVGGKISSTDGTHVTFTVPDHRIPDCNGCPFAMTNNDPGYYSVYLKNANGSSNSVDFKLIPKVTVTADTFTTNLTVGDSGDQVTALQRFLQAKGYFSATFTATGYFGQVTRAGLAAYQNANGIIPDDGYFGPITRIKVNADIAGGVTSTVPTVSYVQAKAADTNTIYSGETMVLYGDNLDGDTRVYLKSDGGSTYQFETSSPSDSQINIAGFITGSVADASYDLYAVKSGITSNKIRIKYINHTAAAPSITMVTPNGGDSWIKGTTQSIKWVDNTPVQTCPGGNGVNCTPGFVATRYDISLLVTPACPTGSMCAQSISVQSVAKNVEGSKYDWVVGRVSNLYGTISDLSDISGQYKIQVCQAGTTICDTSNSPFSIVANTNTGPAITLTSPSTVTAKRNTLLRWTWLANTSTNVDIWLVGNGADLAFAKNYPNNGTFDWAVGYSQTEWNKNVPNGTYQIAVCPTGKEVGPSCGIFAVSINGDVPNIAVVTPQGGETFTAGSSINVAFSGAKVGELYQVNLLYPATGSPITYNLGKITGTSGDTNTNPFTIPSSVPTGNLYTIQVIQLTNNGSCLNACAIAESKKFTINPATTAQSSPTMTASKTTLVSGDSVKLSFTWPANTTSALLTISCTPSVNTGSANICNTSKDVTNIADYTFSLFNASSQSQDVSVSYRVLPGANGATNGVGTTLSVTSINPTISSALDVGTDTGNAAQEIVRVYGQNLPNNLSVADTNTPDYANKPRIPVGRHDATFMDLYVPKATTADRTYNFILYYTDSNQVVQQTLSVSITLKKPVVVNTAVLKISTASVPAGVAGTSYSAPIEGSNGTDSYNWIIASGSLPPGISSVLSTCITAPCKAPFYLYGTPTTAGTYPFTVRLTSGSETVTKDYQIVVTAPTSLLPSSLLKTTNKASVSDILKQLFR